LGSAWRVWGADMQLLIKSIKTLGLLIVVVAGVIVTIFTVEYLRGK
jgi:NADH:ubiquinone oxidoreductase subunit 5 (subunit L)/multisubunit Na+/H+ antiporter MnhA subunit